MRGSMDKRIFMMAAVALASFAVAIAQEPPPKEDALNSVLAARAQKMSEAAIARMEGSAQ